MTEGCHGNEIMKAFSFFCWVIDLIDVSLLLCIIKMVGDLFRWRLVKLISYCAVGTHHHFDNKRVWFEFSPNRSLFTSACKPQLFSAVSRKRRAPLLPDNLPDPDITPISRSLLLPISRSLLLPSPVRLFKNQHLFYQQLFISNFSSATFHQQQSNQTEP
ncbi:hypothetical protein KSP40_PGU022675 [Platanthera guangdongensis]|uniref:Uncharacterized protein n=1 Tax=Platanthera guangdongensis TaxID=2320717 RepID=A0ABR2MEL2_9ASPA